MTTKVQIKVFARDAVDPRALVPVFHRWIREDTLGSDLVVDVVDYSHVHHGPGVLLMGHEGDYALDEGSGQPGLLYSRKRGGPDDLGEALTDALKRALSACRSLEDDPSVQVAFDTRELSIVLPDRLRTPATDETYERARPALHAVLDRVFPEGWHAERQSEDPRRPLTIRVHSEGAGSPRELLARLD